jgi:hypothetical protein
MLPFIMYVVSTTLIGVSVIIALLLRPRGKKGAAIARVTAWGMGTYVVSLLLETVAWMTWLFSTNDPWHGSYVLIPFGAAGLLVGTVVVVIGGIWTLVAHFRK